ncbi:unnamed protein product [Larinioides sclopetarius]|uniref:G domain-containing protein n=1 Tax=Larinioides sclopetarius TaxID=280406 RepID=A0AAV2ASJ5_9ARAC
MAPSLTSRPGRGLNLPNSRDVSSTQNAEEEKSDKLIKSTFHLLERGEKEIRFDDKHKDVILILGNTGSGKSTFTQLLAGDNTKMISKETNEGTGEYIITDNNRIGDTTLKSKTIFPELVIDARTNAAYYDCPGFSDTEGTSYDIATTYFIKKVVDFSESVKMVFTINHPSVRKGVDRQDFMKLVRHVTDLVKDIEKFKNSVAIVATKVDNQYIKQGKNFILVEDIKVVSAIADFLQEAKQYLENSSKQANLSEKENQFYKNAIKFVEVLLEKEGEIYPRIGIFRRPDEPGPVSDIPLLQKGKQDIETILYKKLGFTSKSNEDFGYTEYDKTKNDINVIVEEINKNLWSSLSDIAEKTQEYFRNLVQQVRDKIQLFVSKANAIDVNSSGAEAFRFKFSIGYNITSDLVNKLKNLTDSEQIAVVINNTISNFDIEVSEDDVLSIANQGKYFNFLQTVSDKELNSKPWDQLFKIVEMFLSSSKTLILHDVNSAAGKINNRIQINLNNIAEGIQEEYSEKMRSLEIKNLPEKLNLNSRILLKFTEEIRNGSTTEKLLRGIRCVVNDLRVSLPIQNLQNVANEGKYLSFLEIIGDGALNVDPILWLSPFEKIVKYFNESEKWYRFLDDLYNKFSEYDIQKERKRYNVADLEDWGEKGKPQGIYVTPNTFKIFLNKIENYNVSEYETIRNLSKTTYLHIEELNQILSLTLRPRPTIVCSEPYVIVKGSFISLKETMQNIVDNTDTNNSCNNFKALLDAGKYKLFKVLALNKVFIDTDLSFSGKGMSVAVIAPNWEVVGSRSIDLSGADGAPHAEPKAKNGVRPGSGGFEGKPGNAGLSGESLFGIGSTFVGGAKLKISSFGGKGGPGQNGADGIPGTPGKDAVMPSEKDPPCEYGKFREFSCAKVDTSRIPHFWLKICSTTFHIYGSAGGRGGNGGWGGKGGSGGYPRKIEVLELSQPSKITKVTCKGKSGEDGRGGPGGHGVRNGDSIIAVFISEIDTGCWWGCEKTKWIFKEREPTGLSAAGNKGKDGGYPWGLKDPEPADGISRLPYLINEYKIYLRENINSRFNKSSLLHFLEQLLSNGDVKNLCDTLALFDEFQGLEEQFHKLSEQIDFSSFYTSFLVRISELAKRQNDEPNSNENEKVLNYLYTATLGRLYNVKENSESTLIIDIRGYLNLMKGNIKTLEYLQKTNHKVDAISKFKENYKTGIDKKIEEAKSFIRKQICSEIENINSEIDEQINFLIEETVILQNKAEKDWQKLAEKKKELENALAMKGVFSFLHIIGGIVSF